MTDHHQEEINYLDPTEGQDTPQPPPPLPQCRICQMTDYRYGYTRNAWGAAIVLALFTAGFSFLLFPWILNKRMNCRRCGAPDGGW